MVVASFEERKGYDVLLEALSDLGRDDFELWIVGEGHLPVRGWVHEHNLDRKVKCFGNIHAERLETLYNKCDFFVLSSKTSKVEKQIRTNITASGLDMEGIPVALMEAMSFGKPVISTKHAGIPELVKDILVQEDDPLELRKAIEFLLDHPEKYRKMGERNIEIVRKKYSVDNVKKLLTIFKNEA